MATSQEIVRTTIYRSEVLPSLETFDPQLGEVIAWADAHPFVWQLIIGRRSKVFGSNATAYADWAQDSESFDAILERARHLRSLLHGPEAERNLESIFVWRARFTMEHFLDPDFDGGYFEQHDANGPRSCLHLDYTPETFQEVLDRFCGWMDRDCDTTHVTLDGNTVRTFSREGETGDDRATVVDATSADSL